MITFQTLAIKKSRKNPEPDRAGYVIKWIWIRNSGLQILGSRSKRNICRYLVHYQLIHNTDRINLNQHFLPS